MKPVQLILPIGLPGAGKSTWCRAMFPEHRYIASDDIRQSITGGIYDGSRNPEVWDVYYHDIEVSLHANLNVVADATNLTHRNRERTMSCMTGLRLDASWIHAIVFKNVAQAITRNAVREPGGKDVPHGSQRVPDETMMGMVKLYEESLQDILSEGYDSITYIEEWG